MTKDVITKKGIQRWLMKTILVFGLIAFSGNISAFKSYNSHLYNSELKETGRVNFKRTICFKKVFDRLCYFALQTSYRQIDSFAFSLFHCERNIKVKLRSCFIAVAAIKNQDENFLIDYSSDNSNESETDRLRG